MGGKHKKNNKMDHHQKSSSSSKNSKINKRNNSNSNSNSNNSSSSTNSNASSDTTDNDNFYNEKRHFQKKKRKNNYKKQTVNDIDFEKLDGQLKPLGLYLHSIEGDGNCMFRAIADQLTQSENKHMDYRERCVRYMRMNREEFEPFVLFGGGGGGQGSRHDSDDDDDDDDIGGGAMRDFSSYCDRMARDGVWGGNVELVAISHCEMINIVVHQLDAPKFEITSPFSPKRTIHLSYHMGSHYNSVRAVNERVMEMHNTHGTVYSEIQKKVQIVMSSVMPTVKSNESSSNKSRKKSSKNASSSSVVVDEAYVRQVLQQNDMDTDSAIDFIIMEQQMVREDHRDTQPQYDDENEELSAQDQVYIMQVREYVGDGIPDHVILETLKNSRYQLDLVVEQLMNQVEVYTYESSSPPPPSSASTSTRKSGSSSSCVSSSSSSAPPPKMTKKEKKELKRKQKMKERAAEVMSEARGRSHTTDSTTITTDDFDLSEEELVKLISQTSSVRI